MRPRPDNRSLLQRRHALRALASAPLALTPGVHAQTSAEATPSQTLGPFYPRSAAERPRDTDADLLVVDGDRVLSRGVPLFLTGRVLDRRGNALRDAQVEIWQCDANAVYHHPAGGAEAERDPNFQGYGVARTDTAGRFHFRTIQPVPYPGRTAHIHVRVQTPERVLATQLYLDGTAENRRDFLYSRLSAAEQRLLTLTLQPTRADHPLARATRVMAAIDLVLA